MASAASCVLYLILGDGYGEGGWRVEGERCEGRVVGYRFPATFVCGCRSGLSKVTFY